MAGEAYREFRDGMTTSYETDVDQLGSVTFEDSGDITVNASWGGWEWEARGSDREQAARRLEDRLSGLNPFDGSDTDWGPPGRMEATDEGGLDQRIPEQVRRRMVAFEAALRP
jgi:hypothetical protein